LRAQKLPAARAGAGCAGECGELSVRDGLAAGHRAQRSRAAVEERGLVVEVHRHLFERHGLAGEIGLQQLHHFRRKASTSA